MSQSTENPLKAPWVKSPAQRWCVRDSDGHRIEFNSQAQRNAACRAVNAFEPMRKALDNAIQTLCCGEEEYFQSAIDQARAALALAEEVTP